MSESTAYAQLKTSPHLRDATPVNVIMRNVVYALSPVALYAVFQFGVSAAALLLVCTGVCVATEKMFCRISRKPSTVGDWSAVITGMLLALTLPPALPLWMAAVGAFVSIALGKALFGGLGYNVMNPALVGRAFLQASFTVPMTTWSPSMVSGRFTEFIPSSLTAPFMIAKPINEWVAQMSIDGFSGATPLALMKFDGVATDPVQLMLGTCSGSAGETSSLLILICGLYLVARNMMNYRIALSVLLSAFALSGILYLTNTQAYPSPFFTLFSGGLMLGAVFMATDMVASPVTPVGVWVYGALIGVVTVVIRLWGGLSEGIMYAILLANAFSPLISNITQPRRYGAKPARSSS
jgi:electron transport complex protein RnfD